MRTKISMAAAGAVITAAAILALTACEIQPGQTHDLEGVVFKDPQKSEGYNNVDGHPNLVRLCIDGRAFVTSTRQGDGVTRVPEWDKSFCGATS